MSNSEQISYFNERRRNAVKMRLDGHKIADITESVGLSAPTIIAAHKSFLNGGWPAVDAQPRGRKSGNVAASETLMADLHRAAVGQPNENQTWSLKRLEAHCQQQYGKKIGARTLGGYLDQWQLSAANNYASCKKAGNQVDWLNTTYKAFAENARTAGVAIFWIGRTDASYQGESLAVMYAHTTRGKYHWLARQTSNHMALAIEFLQRLAHEADGPIAIVLADDNLMSNDQFQQALQQQPLVSVLAGPNCTRNSTPNSILKNHMISGNTNTTSTATSANVQDTSILKNEDSKRNINPMTSLTHLQRLEAESIHIMREVVADADKPVMLYSIGKDSAVMLHLAMKAFYPSKPPFALMHVDTGWKFKDMYDFRDKTVAKLGLELIVHKNQEGIDKEVNPFTHGSALHTDIMKTQALKQALDKHGFDCAFGGARRDEEASRAKERVFSFRTAEHHWDPKNQRPELWNLYNTNKMPGESIRVFPISNWTELDVWQYIHQEDIPVVPLYFAAKRPVVMRDEQIIMVDDDRMPMNPGEAPLMKTIRFRTLGCYPLTAAVESTAASVPEIIRETLLSDTSERQGRMIDHDNAASMERKKQEGYF